MEPKRDLKWWFQAQDLAMNRNHAEAENQFLWIDAAIELITDVQLVVNDDPYVKSLRLAESQQDLESHRAKNLVINLVNDAMGSLVNATRMLLSGAHADALTLIRSAFEACCYAEYFVYHPEKVKTFLEIEEILYVDISQDLGKELRDSHLGIVSIQRSLTNKDKEDRELFYSRLCNLGTHPTSKRIDLRLSQPGGGVTAAVSVSTNDWSRKKLTENCANDLMAVTKYALGIPFESYPDWFTRQDDLKRRLEMLAKDYEKL